MEPHELAIAALSQIARNKDLCERAKGNISNESSDSTTGTYPTRPISESGNPSSRYEREAEPCEHSRTGLKSMNPEVLPPVGSRVETTQDTSLIASRPEISEFPRPTASIEPHHYAVATPTAVGQKRTANGQVKLDSPMSPEYSQAHRHSRKISTVSNASTASSSRIGELTAELRTRLSYAMMKVNNGWQSNSIDEVESLASQKGSPTSSTSTVPYRSNLHKSPRAAIASVQRRIGKTQGPIPEYESYYRSEQPTRTYESFWRDHSVPERTAASDRTISPPASRALAPSADIRPAYPQRSNTSSKCSKPPLPHPPPGPSHTSPGAYQASGPQTPQRTVLRDASARNQSTRTTTQEQDAIETLLFMSSPGNVSSLGHALPPPRPQASPQRSPLRTELHIQPKEASNRRCAYSVVFGQNTNVTTEHGSRPQSSTVPLDQEQSTVIDRLLDEMGESSSDEDDMVMKYPSPRRVAAGRV